MGYLDRVRADVYFFESLLYYSWFTCGLYCASPAPPPPCQRAGDGV
ncbi:hypothetical protein POX_c03655 [Penicillium oxalicum]|nr:hypothetical protein POX_c03655 [Penicillium oxalicum]KAI2790805.1 hypothetical protein POX_c03655 [Penicillium oxalicum]